MSEKQSNLTRWQQQIRDDRDLSKTVKVVAWALSFSMNSDTLKVDHLAYGTLAVYASATIETVRAALKTLEDHGYLYVNRGQWKGSASSYRGRLGAIKAPSSLGLSNPKAPRKPVQSPKETIPLLVSTWGEEENQGTDPVGSTPTDPAVDGPDNDALALEGPGDNKLQRLVTDELERLVDPSPALVKWITTASDYERLWSNYQRRGSLRLADDAETEILREVLVRLMTAMDPIQVASAQPAPVTTHPTMPKFGAFKKAS
jgi:hypothetical protein